MTELSEYVITNQIYHGADYQLFHGHRAADQLPIIVKLSASEYPTLRESAMLRHEYTILRLLDGTPGIPRPLDFISYGHGHALIFEDLHARPLGDLLQKYQSELAVVLRIAISLVDTIGRMHAQQIIHKDIRPHNVLIEPNRLLVYLVDFRMAAQLPVARGGGAAGMEGTLSYMSPEQTGRMNRAVDRRTDLYSFGVILYELLTGVVPFTDADALELVHSHLTRRPRPPHERNAKVPPVLSELVMLLLNKNAEERYQSADGIKADLEECLRRFEESHDMAPFALRQHDVSAELFLPQKLYARDAERQALLAAFARASLGAAELVLISGDAGVGKTTLVHELHRVMAQRGHFLEGKCEQFNRNIPYAALAQAFRGFCKQLAQRPELVRSWKQRLLTALGSGAQLISELIPELALLIGSQPAVAVLGPTEAQNRFTLVFQRFVRSFASAEQPLVLFLDDLQWADAASLTLLQTLLTDPERGHLLVIGTYRAAEVDATHPLTALLDAVPGSTTVPATLVLQPLPHHDVVQLVADALVCSAAQVVPLAQLVFDHTRGNPLFIGQLLLLLQQDGQLYFAAPAASWRWELPAMRPLPTNIVEFVVARLRRLPASSQQVLTLAACLGYQFELASLAFILRRSPADIAAELWQPLRQGLIAARSTDYRLIYKEAPDAEALQRLIDNLELTYCFAHDCVQQAAYTLHEPPQKLRLQIGRLLWTRTTDPAELTGESLSALVTHLNQAVELITDPEERLRLAGLNLLAGRRAKAATAYPAAADYFAFGAALLLADAWEEEHTLCFALYAELAECAHLSGRLEQAAALFDMLRGRARSDVERAHLYERRIVLYLTQGRNAAAVELGREALALFAIKLPTTAEGVAGSLLAEVTAVQLHLAGRPIEEWLTAPLLTDPTREAIRRLITELLSPAFLSNPLLNQLLCVTLVNLSMVDGNSAVSPLGFMSYGAFLAISLQQYQEAQRFGRFALALNEKLGGVALVAKLHNVYGSFIHYMCQPLRSGYAYLLSGAHAGLEAGDFPYASYNCLQVITLRLVHGDNLASVGEELEQFLTLMQRTRDAMCTAILRLQQNFIAALEGHAPLPSASEADDAMPPLYAYYQHSLELMRLVLDEDYPAALTVAMASETLAQFTQGMLVAADAVFYAALAAVALTSADYDEPTRARGREAFARYKERALTLDKHCPENFRHRYLLIAAEEARLQGQPLAAMELYEQAITLSQQGEFVHHEALANELCAKFFLGMGRQKVASVYLRSAHSGYLQWGATAKAEQLLARYGNLLILSGELVSPLHQRANGVSETARSIAAELFDLNTVMRAAQAISSEIVLERVLEQVLQIVVPNPGGEQGYLILNHDGLLLLAAQTGAASLAQSSSTPVDDAVGLSRSIVHHVARTRELVLLADVVRDVRFAQDPYLLSHNPKAILCLPLLHQGRLTGILYLENQQLRSAFGVERIELLQLLGSQAASAVEHALLYTRVQQMTDQMASSNQELSETNWRLRSMSEQLRSSNQELGDANTRLQAVTEQLRGSNQELSSANTRLQFELTERVRAEQDRATLQSEIIAAQQARLAEMSTPLIPITEQIMVMPLIGAVDSQRAQQVLDAALQGAQQHGAKVVIIDITGMQHVDASAANSLINTANALRLLGARAVLTGIRAEVAQTLVSLGIDLGRIVTRSTLQSGIAYAMGVTRGGRRH